MNENILKGSFLHRIFISVSLLMFLLVYNTEVEAEGINLEVTPELTAANGYGGVCIDVNVTDIDENQQYYYEIKRSSDYNFWQNIGLGFNYYKETKEIYPEKICVLNVYPDNESFTMSEELKRIHSNIELLKKVYAIQDGKFMYKDNTTSVLPKSASLKIWIEGGVYSGGAEFYKYEDISRYNGMKMLEITQMSMKEFNDNIKSSEQLNVYDTIFFGTWDANCWNDLNDTTYKVVLDYLKNGKGIVFGHDTIAYEILDKGVFSGRFEHENMCKLYDTAGFTAIPKKYSGSSYMIKNNDGYLLPAEYQLWGGDESDKYVTVKFSKTRRAEDSALTTFPYNLLGEDGAGRDLKVPITHTSWMGLKHKDNNVVSFVSNKYSILPETTKNKYEQQPNSAYNWYLCSSNSSNVCYSIQTGHRRNESLEDERKLIANVLCDSYKKESIYKECKYKVDTSAQDRNAPLVHLPELVDCKNDLLQVRFMGEDTGSLYFYYAWLKDKDGGVISQSDEKNVTITTGIKQYCYKLDNNKDNSDFDIQGCNKISVAENDKGIWLDTYNHSKKYIHIKAVDYAGNVSEPMVVSLSDLYNYGMFPLEISTSDEKYLYRKEDKDGIRQYYINANAEFDLEGGCFVNGYPSLNIQPYENVIGKYSMINKLNKSMDEVNVISGKNKSLSENIKILSSKQTRSDNARKLKYKVTSVFKQGSHGKKEIISTIGKIHINNDTKSVSDENKGKLILYCDGESPKVHYEQKQLWYNSVNIEEAFNFNIECTDDGSGFNKAVVEINKYEQNKWENLEKKTTTKECSDFSFISFKQEGNYQYLAYIYDNVWNITPVKVSFNVDVTPPTVSGIENVYGWTNEIIKVEGRANDEFSGVKSVSLCDKSGNIIKTINECEYQFVFEEEQNSEYYIVAEDIAGNISEKYNFTVKIDKTSPEIIIQGISNEEKVLEDNKEFYYLHNNIMSFTATDNNNGVICSGIKNLALKKQNNQRVSYVESNPDNGNINEPISLLYEVLSSDEGDFYQVVAVDKANNMKKVYLVPPLCLQNRIKRYVLHDNFEKRYGYSRVYE